MAQINITSSTAKEVPVPLGRPFIIVNEGPGVVRASRASTPAAAKKGLPIAAGDSLRETGKWFLIAETDASTVAVEESGRLV